MWWKYKVGDVVEANDTNLYTIYSLKIKNGVKFYNAMSNGEYFTLLQGIFEKSSWLVEKGMLYVNWKYKVGDIIKERGVEYKVISKQISSGTYMLLNIKTQELTRVYKEHAELLAELVKPKSLFEQVLALIGVEVEQEFEFEFVNKRVYKFDKYGNLLSKLSNNNWKSSLYDLSDVLTSGKLPKPYKPKSEAELILDELEKAMDKAKVMLERSGR